MPSILSYPVISIPTKKDYRRLRKEFFKSSQKVYENSTKVIYQNCFTNQNNILIDIFCALRYAGKRQYIPKYNNLPLTYLEIQILLQKAEMRTRFIIMDKGLTISNKGIFAVRSNNKQELLILTKKKIQEFKETYKLYQMCDEEEALITKIKLEQLISYLSFLEIID